jgi:YidC/Oxa1 family membrane protein insertase
MQFDRNSVIGFILLAILFFGYFYFTRQAQIELEEQRKRVEDSLARIAPVQRKDTVKSVTGTSGGSDSLVAVKAVAGAFQQSGQGEERLTTVETDLFSFTFTNKGGQPRSVRLKNYRSWDSSLVALVDSGFDRISYLVNVAPNATASSADLYYSGGEAVKNPDGSQTVSYRLSDSSGRSLTHVYTVRPKDYMIDWTIRAEGADRLFSKNVIGLLWQVESSQHERDIQSEKLETQLGLMRKDGFDYFTLGSGVSEKFEEGIKWIGLKQKFFNSTLIARNGFSYADVTMNAPPDSTRLVASSIVNLQATIPSGTNVEVPMQVYYGPNDFKVLKGYGMDLEDMVNLGQGFYAFVKYINRLIVMPFFNFIERMVGNYGLVIALLTIFIRLLTSPLVYSSYLSGAKMKALRPELDVLKEKHKDDQQAFSMEQMKLFRSAGVNPLGGCIPALLQIPIFFALYSFFNSNISLRGEKFWWSNDLSSYDSILSWNTSIPFIGNHLSLFTILAVVTSLLISLYSMSMTPDQGNPMLKYMPYIFPFMLLGIFNSLPSALTWYYTVSNVITLVLQFVIQNYIIDHDKILAQLEENRKKPRAKSKWQERLEQMQETQKRVEAMKNKGGGKKG